MPAQSLDPLTAREHTSRHRDALEASTLCGCFYCLALFPPTEIQEWWDDETTAVCPHCGVDAVIGDSVVTLTPEFLAAMQQYWFQD